MNSQVLKESCWIYSSVTHSNTAVKPNHRGVNAPSHLCQHAAAHHISYYLLTRGIPWDIHHSYSLPLISCKNFWLTTHRKSLPLYAALQKLQGATFSVQLDQQTEMDVRGKMGRYTEHLVWQKQRLVRSKYPLQSPNSDRCSISHLFWFDGSCTQFHPVLPWRLF